MTAIAFSDIEAAAARLAGHAVVTPLIESPALNERLGGRVLIKPETLQRAGAFKFRGAWNRISQLSAEERARGVVACSSGNHAQGVALVAKLLGAPAVIVMPADAPPIKVAGTKGYGAEVIHYDRYTENREAIVAQVAAERGMTVVPPYDDPHVMAGQGTIGLELARQAPALDRVLVPVGGGGLAAGVSTALKALSPGTEVWGVEPWAFDDTVRSLEAKERVAVDPARRSICDALQTPMPGELTFPINRVNLAGVLTVTDAEVAEAIRYAFKTLKLVVEPGGSVALAALLAGKLDVTGQTVGVVLSGGNIDPALFASILAGDL